MNQVAKNDTGTMSFGNWSSRQLETMHRTICPDADDSEFQMFLEYAIAKRLDPFLGHIIMIVYKTKKQGERRKPTIITTQAGCRVLAARCGDYSPAKPGDTLFTYTAHEIERQLLLDEAAKIFKKDERAARLADINENMPPDPANPSGIIKCETCNYKDGKAGCWRSLLGPNTHR